MAIARKNVLVAGLCRRCSAAKALPLFLTAMLAILPVVATAEHVFRTAVLDEPTMPVKGCSTPVATFVKVFGNEKLSLARLTAAELADPALFNRNRFEMLVLPTGASFPKSAHQTLLAFLQHGGHILCTGGYAFDNPMELIDGKWTACSEMRAKAMERARDPAVSLIPNGDFSHGDADWHTDNPANCSVVREGVKPGDWCGKAVSSQPDGGARYGCDLPTTRGTTYTVSAMARADHIKGSGFAYLAVYQYAADGKLVTFRDFMHMRSDTNWTKGEFQFTVAPNTERTVFYGGLYLASGTMMFTNVTCAPVPAEVRINAHYGEPLDNLILAPTQLTIFSPDQPIHGACLASAPGSPIKLQRPIKIPVSGYEATAQLQQFGRWNPLVELRDAMGRFAGTAGAMVHHDSGPFAGSDWIFFGVNNRDIFAGSDGEDLLRQVLRLAVSPIRMEQLQTDFAMYEPGEEMKCTLRVSASSDVQTAINWLITTPNGKQLAANRETVSFSARERRNVDFAWKAPANGTDFAIVAATLESGETIRSGFCIRRPKIVSAGTHIAYEQNAYTLKYANGTILRTMLFGTDTYGNMLLSRSCDPLTWYNDLKMMRDYGLHMYENLQYPPANYAFTKQEERKIDALMQLSQKFGLPYMAGLEVGQNVATDDDTLTKQANYCGWFAARYKKVPGLIYYLNGDFQLNLENKPDLRRHWNEFLRNRYGSDDVLRKAWGANAPAETIGNIPLIDSPPSQWLDSRARDVNDYKTWLLKRWISTLCGAIRKEDAIHPITSEYYQHPFNGIDVRFTLDGMDAANFGYFDVPHLDMARLPAVIKWNDMRYDGGSVNIGEFGVKTHDAWAPDRDSVDYHIGRTEREQRALFWWVVHAGLATNVTKIQNWCWSDDPDLEFPWGLAWCNPLRPKPVLKVYRNLRILSDLAGSADKRANVVFVMPDAWRVAAVEFVANAAILNSLECLLRTGAPFDTVGQNDLDRLAKNPPPLVVMPYAYGLSDNAIKTIEKLADAGSTVYLSGDPSIGTYGASFPDRLPKLCGVRWVSHGEPLNGMPSPNVLPAGARKIETSVRLPIYQYKLGKGSIVYSPTPWEALPNREIFLKEPETASSPETNFYLSLLGIAGVKAPASLNYNKGIYKVMQASCASGLFTSVFPCSQANHATVDVALTMKSGAFKIGVSPDLPASLLTNKRGQLVAATADSRLTCANREVARGECPWMLAATDGKDIASSRILAAMLLDGGKLSWSSNQQGLKAWIVEWHEGKTVVVGTADTKKTASGYTVTIPANELALICPKDRLNVNLQAWNRP